MNNRQLAEKIVDQIGGSENITQSWHCITRLRFNVADVKKVNVENIKQLDGVIGAQFQSGQFQVIIGNEVADVFKEIQEFNVGNASEEQLSAGKQGNVVERVFDVISGIFTPILAAITGSGLLKGIMAIAVAANLLAPESSTYAVLNAISDAAFHFLPFLIAFSAANKFKTNPSLAVALAGILMYPTFMQNAAAGEISSLAFFGLPIPMNSYASSVLPIILGVWLLSYVEKYAKRIIPQSLSIIFVPLLALLITAPITLAFIAPAGTIIGVYLERLFTGLFNVAGPLAGALLGGLMPLIVITGMHYAFFPSAFASFERFGYDVMLLPMNLVANLAQAGATLGVAVKTKDTKMKQLAVSSFIPALFGITEPAIYGVTMKLKKPFYSSLIGGAVGGAIYGTFAVKALSFTVPGLLALPTYIEEGTNNVLLAILGVTASFLTGFVLTLILKFDTGQATAAETVQTGAQVEKSEQVELAVATRDVARKGEPLHILSPMSGEVVSLADCPDETFASQVVGKGLGILPDTGEVRAPFDGTVSMTTPTNHAIGLISHDGVELLIHVGIDTVALKGEYFQAYAKEGQEVKEGELLLMFDLEILKEKGTNLYSPIIVTNTPQFLDVLPSAPPKTRVEGSSSELLIAVN